MVSTRAHWNSEAMRAAGRDTTRTCTGTRTATRRRWRLSGLDHMEHPARLRGSRCSREASAKAGRVAARERSTSTFSSIKINAFLNPFFISLFLQWLRHHLKNRKKPHKKRGWNHLSFLRLINAK